MENRRELLSKARDNALAKGGSVEGQAPSVDLKAKEKEETDLATKKVEEANAARKAQQDNLRSSVQSSTKSYEESSKPRFPNPKAAIKQEAPPPPATPPPPPPAPTPPPQPQSSPFQAPKTEAPKPEPSKPAPFQAPSDLPKAEAPAEAPKSSFSFFGKGAETPKPEPPKVDVPKPPKPELPKLPEPAKAKPSVASAKQVTETKGKKKGPLPMTLAQIIVLGIFGGITYATTKEAEKTAGFVQLSADAIESAYNAVENYVSNFAGKPSETVAATPRTPSGIDATQKGVPGADADAKA